MEFTFSPHDSASEAHNRCKIISFRVSDDEYCAVEAASRRHGFRSVALFARWIILTEKIDDPAQTPVDCDINRLWRRVEALMAALEGLMGQMSSVRDTIQA
ncbi:MAG: hypothetical protein ACJ74Y_08585 [Bryobacteraceae bacterium]